MHLLITGGDSALARRLATALAPDLSIRLFDRAFTSSPASEVETVTGDPCDPADVARALEGIDAILHLAPYLPGRDREADDITALDEATRGTFVLVNAAREAGVARILLASTLDLFDRLPAHYDVNEVWRPRPTPEIAQLCPWLAELSLRENARRGQLQAICLRLGQIIDDAHAASHPFDPRWVHIDDVVHAIHCGLRYQPPHLPHWAVFHIMAPGPRAKIRLRYAISAAADFGYAPTHDFQAHWPTDPNAFTPRDNRPWREILAPRPMSSRPIRRVVIFGAGGPMGAVTTQELSSSYTLRVTDVRPITEIAAEAKPQSRGAPLPIPLADPHESRVVDVRDPVQVMTAVEGMDAIINCTVVRPHPVNAFLVNTIGAYNVMRAAVAHNIRRVVHTGPLVQHLKGMGDHSGDYDLHVDAPPRPYDHLYIHSKYLGTEICRVFAEYYGLEVPALLFMNLYNPEMPAPVPHCSFMISWPDTGRALRRGLEVTSLPSPFEMVNISADLPHGRYDFDKARTLLNWQPRDGLEEFWQEPVTSNETTTASPVR
ncbi:MAG: NAD(P)-dependent oxidoreductase [Caldilineaceae bacterium]|nr:NAD(P)-dependent oxidoreductase [Caldilineaceae bacterium]